MDFASLSIGLTLDTDMLSIQISNSGRAHFAHVLTTFFVKDYHDQKGCKDEFDRLLLRLKVTPNDVQILIILGFADNLLQQGVDL